MGEINTNRMTSGNPAGHILRFSVPLMFGNIFQQLYTLVDTVVVGKTLGVNALAALGTTEWMIFLVTGAIQGITHGFSVVIAQRFGSRDDESLRAAVSCSAALSAVFAVFFTVLAQCLIPAALRIIRVPGEVYDMALSYLRIIYAGIPASFAYHMAAAVLRALGNSRAPLKAVTIASVCNGLLDIYFVILLHRGIQGAAWATVTAEIISAVYCFLVLRRIQRQVSFRKRGFDRAIMLDELKMGLPLGLQNILTATGGLVVQSVINGFGVLFIAGYTAANKLYGLLEIPASSYGYTMSAFTGQNIGAGKTERVKKGLAAGLIICIITAMLMSGIMAGAGGKIAACFIAGSAEASAETIKIASDFLMILAVFFPLLYILYSVRGCIQGLGNSALPMASSLIQLLMRVGSALFLTRMIGEYGVFWGEILAWAGADLLLGYGFFRLMGREKGVS